MVSNGLNPAKIEEVLSWFWFSVPGRVQNEFQFDPLVEKSHVHERDPLNFLTICVIAGLRSTPRGAIYGQAT